MRDTKRSQKMKNQKFFFSVVVMLFVLGVFVLFFFGFKSRVFAKVGAVGLVPKQRVVAVNNVGHKAVVGRVIKGVTDKTDGVALVAVKQLVTSVRGVSAIEGQTKVSRVSALVKRVPITVSLSRQSVVV